MEYKKDNNLTKLSFKSYDASIVYNAYFLFKTTSWALLVSNVTDWQLLA